MTGAGAGNRELKAAGSIAWEQAPFRFLIGLVLCAFWVLAGNFAIEHWKTGVFPTAFFCGLSFGSWCPRILVRRT
jgi:hypothetical protein